MSDAVNDQAGSGIIHSASFDAKSLAKLLFGIYHKMFADEGMSWTNQHYSLKIQQAASNIHYVRRATFAELLQEVVKHQVQTDWALVMDTLHTLLIEDRKLLVGLNNYQDLCCQLHLLGVDSVELLTLHQTIVKVSNSPGIFRQWETVPPVVCVVLVIPRSSLKVLEEILVEAIRTPQIFFQCDVITENSHSFFSSIHPVFGQVTSTGTIGDPQISVVAAPSGWSGTSNLMVSFWMPSWILTMSPQTTSIGLSVRSTPATSFLTPKLDFGLCTILSTIA